LSPLEHVEARKLWLELQSAPEKPGKKKVPVFLFMPDPFSPRTFRHPPSPFTLFLSLYCAAPQPKKRAKTTKSAGRKDNKTNGNLLGALPKRKRDAVEKELEKSVPSGTNKRVKQAALNALHKEQCLEQQREWLINGNADTSKGALMQKNTDLSGCFTAPTPKRCPSFSSLPSFTGVALSCNTFICLP